jgi:hypothetical protein
VTDSRELSIETYGDSYYYIDRCMGYVRAEASMAVAAGFDDGTLTQLANQYRGLAITVTEHNPAGIVDFSLTMDTNMGLFLLSSLVLEQIALFHVAYDKFLDTLEAVRVGPNANTAAAVAAFDAACKGVFEAFSCMRWEFSSALIDEVNHYRSSIMLEAQENGTLVGDE